MMIRWSLKFKQLARNEPRKWTYTPITPYVEFLKNSHLHCRCCIGVLTTLVCFLEETESLFVRWELIIVHAALVTTLSAPLHLQNVRLTFSKFRLTARACADGDIAALNRNFKVRLIKAFLKISRKKEKVILNNSFINR